MKQFQSLLLNLAKKLKNKLQTNQLLLLDGTMVVHLLQMLVVTYLTDWIMKYGMLQYVQLFNSE